MSLLHRGTADDLTAAYYVLAALDPSLMASGVPFAVARSTAIDRILAALRASRQHADDMDARGHAYVHAVMAQDDVMRDARVCLGGW